MYAINSDRIQQMNPEERSLLQQTYELAKENNQILRGIRRTGRIGTILKVCYWAVIILISLGAYVFIQPYLDQLKSIYSGAQEGLNSIKDITGGINSIKF